MIHPRELLPLIAEGHIPDAETRSHIASCSSCRDSLHVLSSIDLDYAWSAIQGELDAPKPSLLERFLVTVGVDSGIARFASLTPTLRPAWLLATIGVLALVAAASMLAQPSVELTLLVAPLVAAVGVSHAYGPIADPAHEVTITTPLSPVTALLVRLTLVLAVDSLLVGVSDVIVGDASLAWVLPMTAVSLGSATIAVRLNPILGAATGMLVWTCFVAITAATAHQPEAIVAGPLAQALYALVTVAGLAALITWSRNGLVQTTRRGAS